VQELQGGDPQRIGPYRVVGRLGSGGMGTVFAGRSAGGRLVAVKVIRGELADDAEFRVRFSREVAAARSVSGLFTAPVVDADVEGPVPWLATAYVAGPSLADAVRRHGPLPAASVLALAAGLAEGLQAIHAAGLIHRDLKPSNVLLADDGPRVIDFGISRTAEATALTAADLVIGSPGFMSPEQAEGRPTGPPSDVFSLGAVVAFAATGTGPFGTGSTAALVYRVVHSPPELEGTPAEIRSLAERCLAKDPGQRPTTAELLTELESSGPVAGWLPAPVVTELPRHAGALAEASDWPPTAPGSAPPTMTVARPGEAPAGSRGPAETGGSPGETIRRSRRRPALLLLLFAGVLAAAAATAVGIDLAGSKPTAGPRPSVPPVSSTAHSTLLPVVRAASSSADAEPPAAPTQVTATALNQYTIHVTWTDDGTGITGFNVSNGCGTDGCDGGALNVRTGRVSAIDVTTTPGAYQCFYVQAFNQAGTATSPAPGCISTPGLNIPTDREWTDTGVTVTSGAAVGISAAGEAYLSGAGSSQAPDGNSACKPATSYPAGSSQFPAPELPCWSLIARIGNGPPFEVGTSTLVSATTGRLYLGVNSDSFSGNTGIWTVKIKIGGLP
jgi:serine/threonine protein kinase